MHQSDDIDWFQFKQIFGHKIKLIMGLDTIVNIVILVIQEIDTMFSGIKLYLNVLKSS